MSRERERESELRSQQQCSDCGRGVELEDDKW